MMRRLTGRDILACPHCGEGRLRVVAVLGPRPVDAPTPDGAAMTGTGPQDGIATDRRAGAPGRPRDGSPSASASGNRRGHGHRGVAGSPGTRLDGRITAPRAGRRPVVGG